MRSAKAGENIIKLASVASEWQRMKENENRRRQLGGNEAMRRKEKTENGEEISAARRNRMAAIQCNEIFNRHISGGGVV